MPEANVSATNLDKYVNRRGPGQNPGFQQDESEREREPEREREREREPEPEPEPKPEP